MFKLEKLAKVLGADMFSNLKKAFEDEAPVEPIVTTEQGFVSTADGMKIEGSIEVGSAITSEGQPVVDGTYVLDNGKTITCSGGLITEVSETETEEIEEEVMSEEKVLSAIQSALEVKDAEHNSIIEEIKNATIEYQKKTDEKFSAMLTALEAIADLKQSEPEKKDDPKQKFAQKRAQGFSSLLQSIDKIKNK